MNLDEMADEMRRLSDLLDKGLASLRSFAQEYADAEAAYRETKARAWLQAPEGTVPEREAWVNGHTAKERRARDLADSMRQAALESVRSRRGQISAWQTMVNAWLEESKWSRTGPEMAA